MLNLVKEICDKVGPRPAGSEQEKKAQQLMLEKAAAYTDKLEFLPFDEYLEARFGKVRYYVFFFFASMALYWVMPVSAAIIGMLSATILVLDIMMYRDILTTMPGRKATSSNATATLEPQGEVKSTLIFSAHIDSTREFTWWYKLGHTGVVLTVVAGLLMVFSAVFLMVHSMHKGTYDNYIWGVFAALSPLTIFWWSMRGDNFVYGAQDNLSGIAISFEVFKTLADPNNKGRSVLKNTRLRFLSFGSEEPGLMGSRAYAALKKDELHKENAHLINVDNVRQAAHLTIIHKEIMTGTQLSPMLSEKLQQSFKAVGVPYKMGVAPIGGSDAVSLARVGIPAITVIGMDSAKHDFTYHTRHDIPEHIEADALEKLKTVLLNFTHTWDGKAV